MRQGQNRSRRPEVPQSNPAVDVLAEVEHLPAGHPASRHWPELVDRAHWRRRRGHEFGRAAVGYDDRIPAGVVEVRLGPAVRHAPQIDRLAGDEISCLDLRPGASPPRAGAGDRSRPAGEVRAHLGHEPQLRSPLVVGARKPDLPAEPAVGQDRADRVSPRPQQLTDVVGLDLEPRSVFREPRGKLGVAGAPAVNEHLVDTVGGRVQPRTGDGRVRKLELAAHQHRRPPTCRRQLGLDGRDPPHTPIFFLEQPELEHGRV